MATGTIEFAVPVVGLRLEQIEVSNWHPAVEKVVLETQDGERLRIVFHLINVFTFEDAEAIADGILPSIVNRLAFYRNTRVGDPYFTGGSLPKDTSGSSYTVTGTVRIRGNSAMAVDTPSATERREIARLLEEPYTHNELYSAYRFASNQSDAVARFMFFYNVLLQLHNDNQGHVDTFIRQEEPNVPQSTSPHKPSVMETVYTRLRNEVSHRRTKTTPEQTRTEIEGNVAALQQLVKTAISRIP